MSAFLALALMLGGIAAAFWSMFETLYALWSDRYGAYSHGYLVLAISIWFAFRAWRAPPRPVLTGPMWSAVPILLGLIGLAALAEALYLGAIRTAVLPLLVLTAIALCLGSGPAKRLAWPLLFLYFALPVWGVLNTPLQSLTTVVAQSIVQATGVPVYVEGNFVHLTAGTFEIASGCSGLNYFVSALTLAAVYASLFLGRWSSRVTLMLATAVAGLVANWLRVASLIVIGHATGMQHYLIRVDHLYFGWALFILVMIPVCWLARRLETNEPAITPSEARWVKLAWVPPLMGRLAWIFISIIAAGVLALFIREQTRSAEAGKATVPATLIANEKSEGFSSGWQPNFPGAKVRRQEWEGEGIVEIFTASYPRQEREARLSLPENSATGEGWQVTDSRIIQSNGSAPGARHVETRGNLAGRERLLWTWFVVAGRGAYSKPSLRTAELLGLLSGRRDAWVVALQTECHGDCDLARQRLRAAMQQP